MCGIFGILFHHKCRVPDSQRLNATAMAMHHRGPDHHGFHKDQGIALVHTRLALVDLAPRSNQPFWDPTGRYALVYNGEIYNFMELRHDLEHEGVIFQTTSDTEVLLLALLHFGFKATLPRLEGMFAFALYDRYEQSFSIARDRFGIKPLLIYDQPEKFVFASEYQAIRPWIKLEPDYLSISSYLYGFGGPTKGCSFFKHIKILPPGMTLTIKRGNLASYDYFFHLEQFWDANQAARLSETKLEQAADKLDELLNVSVKSQLMADAPVGALCSGGVDSSLILAIAARFHNNLAIFHANVKGPLSEFHAASQLAKYLKLDLKTVDVLDQDFIECFPYVTAHYGHPFYVTPHSVPFYLVCKLVRSHAVKAVLSGEGADELFWGYNFMSPHQSHPGFYQRAKQILKKILVRKHGIQKPAHTEWETYSGTMVGLSSERLIMGMHNRFEVALETKRIIDCLQKGNCKEEELEDCIKSLDLMNFNLRALLHRNDTLGMASSIESRFPILDSQLVQLAVNLPPRSKIDLRNLKGHSNDRLVWNKIVFRTVADRYLPRQLSRKAKGPFSVDAFRRMQISPAFFSDSLLMDLFNLDPCQMQYLIENADHQLKLKLLHLEVWTHACLYNRSKAGLLEKMRANINIKTV